MAAMIIRIKASSLPGLWTLSSKYLFAGSQFQASQKRCFAALGYKPLNGGPNLLAVGRLDKKCDAQLSSKPFKTKLKQLLAFKQNPELLRYQQKIGNHDSRSSLSFSVLKVLSLKSLFSTPYPFMAYGVSGLIPFMTVPAYMLWTDSYCPSLAYCQLVYGACILSFLGGVSWGNEMSDAKNSTLASLSYSILLPLIAWPAVLLYPQSISFGVMIGGIAYAGFRDILNPRYPKWFINLRFLLSTMVVSALTTTLIFYWTKTSHKDTEKVQNPGSKPITKD